MFNRIRKFATITFALAIAPAAFAVPTSIFDLDKDAGAAAFDATVTATGATVTVDVLSGLASGVSSWDQGAYTISNNDGSTSNVFGPGLDNSSGEMIGINPEAPGFPSSGAGGIGGGLADPEEFFNSGITFTFDDAINAIGFEVGDWGTCCQPSSPVS